VAASPEGEPNAPTNAEAAPSSPETLETPYAETPPPAPATSPPPPPAGAIQLKPELADIRPERPIRALRRVALLGEIGWNGLAGVGAIVTYHASPHISLDMGGGLSLTGFKGGVRGRYNLSTRNFTPFVGAGFNATSGWGQVTSDPKNDPQAKPDEQPFTLDVGPSYFANCVIGVEFVHRRGFTLQGALGYARLLNKNVRLIDGSLTPEQRKGIDIAFKSGPVISVAVGTSFR
jgi:hypothetical protein